MRIKFNGQTLKLRSLSDPEYNQAEALARQNGVPLDHCPTCKARETPVPDAPGVTEFNNGMYKFRDHWYECDCQAQMALRARYLLANIGAEYMKLDWDDFDGDPKAREWVDTYIEKWDSFRNEGFGLEFGGNKQGVGKTFCATHIGKELIKRGQKVYFYPFIEVMAAYDRDDAQEVAERLRTTTFLILDEILPPFTDKQQWFFGNQLEALIRHRTNHNLPTIITTNMSQKSLTDAYPRTYALLAAKQIRVDMTGEDYRGKLGMENFELIANGETRPIT